MASFAIGQSNYKLLRGGDEYCQNANMELVNSASQSCCILIGHLKQKPSDSCHKLIKNYRYVPHGNSTMHSNVSLWYIVKHLFLKQVPSNSMSCNLWNQLFSNKCCSPIKRHSTCHVSQFSTQKSKHKEQTN